MRYIGLAFLATAMAFPAAANTGTMDFAFLVEQRVVTVQCGIPNDLMLIEDAITEEGERLGWSRMETIRQLEGRRLHQLAKYQANPDGYCMMAGQLRSASKNRLRSLGASR